MPRSALALLTALGLFVGSSALAQQEITSIPFESIPAGTSLVGGGSSILLDGYADVNGEVSTTEGVRFGDGTLQVTAAVSNASANGLYGNRIPDITPPNAYSEVCFKAGSTMSDVHSVSEPTAGGNCLPGDIGWIIERDERDSGTSASWEEARASCLQDGLRLPEPFEFYFTCTNAVAFGILDLTDDFEWSSNLAFPASTGSTSGIGSPIIGGTGGASCDRGTFGWLGRSGGAGIPNPFRCAL
ncbi:MAG: hypothetical protein KDD11_15240 [Acidobacteria bacterium]|nr:hypothetical protein [Acidobacteriota bacterium]